MSAVDVDGTHEPLDEAWWWSCVRCGRGHEVPAGAHVAGPPVCWECSSDDLVARAVPDGWCYRCGFVVGDVSSFIHGGDGCQAPAHPHDLRTLLAIEVEGVWSGLREHVRTQGQADQVAELLETLGWSIRRYGVDDGQRVRAWRT